MRSLKAIKCEDICHQLDDYLVQCDHKSRDKVGLKILYKDILGYLKHTGYSELVKPLTSRYSASNKWPNLILHTIFIHGTISGVISSMLAGIGGLSFVASSILIYFLPVFAALPYFIHKVKADVSKSERILRIYELTLIVKFHVLLIEANRQALTGKLKNLKLKPSGKLLSVEHKRGVFNSTFLETLYLSGSLFPLGISLLVTFSMATPIGWCLVTAISVLAGIAYACYHHKVVKEMEAKEKRIKVLSGLTANFEATLFKPANKHSNNNRDQSISGPATDSESRVGPN